jgi:hypothetical protein
LYVIEVVLPVIRGMPSPGVKVTWTVLSDNRSVLSARPTPTPTARISLAGRNPENARERLTIVRHS